MTQLHNDVDSEPELGQCERTLQRLGVNSDLFTLLYAIGLSYLHPNEIKTILAGLAKEMELKPSHCKNKHHQAYSNKAIRGCMLALYDHPVSYTHEMLIIFLSKEHNLPDMRVHNRIIQLLNGNCYRCSGKIKATQKMRRDDNDSKVIKFYMPCP